jgi:TonB-dependent receptor
MRTTINFSRAGHLFGKKFSNVTSLSYANSKQTFTQKNKFYEDFNGEESPIRYGLEDERYSSNIRVGIISNFILELNHNNRIEFRNLFNQQGTMQTTFREGFDHISERYVKDLALNYFSRRIYSGQLNGKHSLNDKVNVSWMVGYSNVFADQPDYRTISSRKSIVDTEYSIIIPPTASLQDGGRFFSDLNENVYTQATNLELKLNPEASDKLLKKLQFGYYASYTQRSFDARWFAYGWSPFSNRPSDILVGTPFTEIFKAENIGLNTSGDNAPYFILNEGTSFTDSYEGRNLLTAGYANLSLPISEKLRLSSGVRAEYNNQELMARETNGSAANVENPVLSILPFINITFNYTEKSLIRVAYSKTVNRPVFRELAGFNYYDFNRRANFFGNADLKTADIHNVDLRWEMYPSANESLSFGVFYKQFNNPIEQLLYGGANPLYTYANADKATSYGLEIEARKSLKNLLNSSVLERFSVLLNAALIKSEVQYADNVTNQERNRAMQGQSPYIINAGLYYNDFETGWQANVSYNVFGKRIFAVGDNNIATQYEMPRNQIDITVSKSFGEKFEAKFGVQDILNQQYRLVQDSDRNKKINAIDEPIQNYAQGQYITLGFTYKIN